MVNSAQICIAIFLLLRLVRVKVIISHFHAFRVRVFHLVLTSAAAVVYEDHQCTGTLHLQLQQDTAKNFLAETNSLAALSTFYQHSNACPAWTEVLNVRFTHCERKIKRSKVKSRMRTIQNTIDVYKQQNTTTMPRVNEKKGEKNQWSDEQLQAAMEAVSSGKLKAHAAAKQYGIP